MPFTCNLGLCAGKRICLLLVQSDFEIMDLVGNGSDSALQLSHQKVIEFWFSFVAQ